MAMNSNKPNWEDLTSRARQAAVPADLDVRHSIRQQIEMSSVTSYPVVQMGLWEELFALGGARWLQLGLTCLFATAGWACWQGLSTLNELTLLWSVEVPFLAHF